MGSHSPQQGPMELATLARYLARAHNRNCENSARWGLKGTNRYLEAWNFCNATAAGLATPRPGWLAQRAIQEIIEVCSIDFE
jgi:hypothetical protein